MFLSPVQYIRPLDDLFWFIIWMFFRLMKGSRDPLMVNNGMNQVVSVLIHCTSNRLVVYVRKTLLSELRY